MASIKRFNQYFANEAIADFVADQLISVYEGSGGGRKKVIMSNFKAIVLNKTGDIFAREVKSIDKSFLILVKNLKLFVATVGKNL